MTETDESYLNEPLREPVRPFENIAAKVWTDQPTRLEVTPLTVDRERAADFIRDHGGLSSAGLRLAIREGKDDSHALVQAFAAHRIAEHDRCNETVRSAFGEEQAHRLAHTVPGDAGLREALEPFVNAGMKADPTWSDCATISNNRCGNDLTLGHLRAVMRIYAGLCARSALSTSPVIDTNGGLAERVEERLREMLGPDTDFDQHTFSIKRENLRTLLAENERLRSQDVAITKAYDRSRQRAGLDRAALDQG